jgi:hypothetical protein
MIMPNRKSQLRLKWKDSQIINVDEGSAAKGRCPGAIENRSERQRRREESWPQRAGDLLCRDTEGARRLVAQAVELASARKVIRTGHAVDTVAKQEASSITPRGAPMNAAAEALCRA